MMKGYISNIMALSSSWYNTKDALAKTKQGAWEYDIISQRISVI